MTKNILVVTNAHGFGELIQQTLEDSRQYIVQVVEDGTAARQQIRDIAFHLVILDETIEAGALPELARVIRLALPKVSLILIPPENDLRHPIIKEVSPQGILTKPFYLPDLLDTIKSALQPGAKPVQIEPELTSPSPLPEIDPEIQPQSKLPEWQNDIELATLRLQDCMSISEVQSALLFKTAKVWAYAGQITKEEAQEIGSILQRQWMIPSSPILEGEKINFIRLASSGKEYQLYSIPFDAQMILGAVFPARTPFSKIRAQVGLLKRTYTLDNPVITKEETLPSPEASPSGEAELNPELMPLFDNVPSPIPDKTRITKSVRSIGNSSNNPAYPEPVSFPKPGRPNTLKKIAPGLQPNIKGSIDSPVQTTSDHRLPTIEPAQFPEEILDDGLEVDEMTAQTEGESETMLIPQPVSLETMTSTDELRPTSPAMHSLNYTCLLIPRMPGHQLTGDLAENLVHWATEICTAFGWRLEHCSTRPDVFQCIVNAPPSNSPGYLLRILRIQTSQRIFAEFPNLANENPSGDFWAPGYLILSGSQPPHPQQVQEYINRTRAHQGTLPG